MDEELRAAVERYRGDNYPDTCDGTWLWEADCHVIADAYIRELDQRAAQQADHELPVDEEFVASIAKRSGQNGRYEIYGLTQSFDVVIAARGVVRVNLIACGRWTLAQADPKRGELLDLLHGLGATDEDLARLGAMNTNEKGEVT